MPFHIHLAQVGCVLEKVVPHGRGEVIVIDVNAGELAKRKLWLRGRYEVRVLKFLQPTTLGVQGLQSVLHSLAGPKETWDMKRMTCSFPWSDAFSEELTPGEFKNQRGVGKDSREGSRYLSTCFTWSEKDAIHGQKLQTVEFGEMTLLDTLLFCLLPVANV